MKPAPSDVGPAKASGGLDEAKALHAEGNIERARALYHAVLASQPENADALHLLGLLQFQQGELAGAEALIREALVHRPQFMRAFSNLGAVLMGQKRFGEARDAFRAALALDGDDLDARFNLGTAAQAEGHMDEAIASYRRVLEHSPGMHEARLNLGVALLDSGDLDGALSTLSEAVQHAPRMAQGHYNLGIALKAGGQLDLACTAFQSAWDLAPTSTDAAFNLGTTLQAMGRLEESAVVLGKVLAVNPGLASAHYALASVLREDNDLQGALASFQQAATLDPGDEDTQHAISVTRLQLGDARGSLDAVQRVLDNSPGSTRDLGLQGIALAISGDREAAHELVNLDRFLHPRVVDAVDGYGSVAEFNAALRQHVLTHPTLMESPDRFATRNGLHSLEVLEGDEQPVPALRSMIEKAVHEYISTHPRDPTHPFLRDPPRRWHLTGWAVVMREQGHQVAHIHPTAWLSGVYYVQVPSGVSKVGEGNAGWIEFGRPDEIIPHNQEMDLRLIRPEPGKMVLFPGYFYHGTIPLAGTEERICVAFDVVRDD